MNFKLFISQIYEMRVVGHRNILQNVNTKEAIDNLRRKNEQKSKTTAIIRVG